MFSFNIILTERCNAKCSHCYMSDDGYSKKLSLTKSQIDNLFEKIPADTKTIVFTGGEVFLEKDLLYYAIKKAKKVNDNIEIGVESNGIILYNGSEDYAKKELEELKNVGVSFIRFSDDSFHEDGGVDLNRVRALKKLESYKTPKIKFLVQTTALAIGRAKTLEKEKQAKMNCMNSENSVENPYLFLDICGNVFTCAWKCAPKISNIFENDFQDVIINLKKDVNKLILAGKIEEAAKLYAPSEYKENKKFLEENGQCLLCNKIFKGE